MSADDLRNVAQNALDNLVFFAIEAGARLHHTDRANLNQVGTLLQAFADGHPPVRIRPLIRQAAGHYESRDGRWTFGKMEAVGAWFVWEADDEYAHTDRFATLRDAVDYAEAESLHAT